MEVKKREMHIRIHEDCPEHISAVEKIESRDKGKYRSRMDYIAAAIGQMDKTTLVINLDSLPVDLLEAIRRTIQKQEEGQNKDEDIRYM